jgi:hypothetical protein
MAVPDIAELEKAARKIVQNGKKDGKLRFFLTCDLPIVA